MTTQQLDRAKAEEFAGQMIGIANAGLTALMISVGHRTGEPGRHHSGDLPSGSISMPNGAETGPLESPGRRNRFERGLRRVLVGPSQVCPARAGEPGPAAYGMPHCGLRIVDSRWLMADG